MRIEELNYDDTSLLTVKKRLHILLARYNLTNDVLNDTAEKLRTTQLNGSAQKGEAKEAYDGTLADISLLIDRLEESLTVNEEASNYIRLALFGSDNEGNEKKAKQKPKNLAAQKFAYETDVDEEGDY